TAQILIRWALQRGLVVIPKSSNRRRIVENADVFDFEISKDDMRLLDNFNENLRTCWDPSDAS
ncbi:MAG TPA: aldo/keto reductase, partial [Candidatus Binatia bacterium]|nr:aldo/keto reductase [Candidatus Binatia bacterium]